MSDFDIVNASAQSNGDGSLAPRGEVGMGMKGVGRDASGSPQRNILHVIWRGRWFVLLGMIVGVAAGIYYLSQQTPIYSSSAKVLVEAEQIKVMPGSEGFRAQTGNFLQTQCELIKSSQILGPVAALPEVAAMRTFTGSDSPIGIIKLSLTAEPGQKDDLINISFESPYPEEAASVVNAIVDSYKAYQASRHRSTAAEVLRILTNEKRDRDKELADKQRKMTDFRKENPQFRPLGERGNIGLEKLGEQLTMVHLDAVETKGLLDSAKAMANDPARVDQWQRMQQRNSAENVALQGEIQRLELEAATNRQLLGPQHSKVKSIEAQITALKQRLSGQSHDSFDAYLDAINQRYALLTQREKELQTEFDKQQKELSASSSLNDRYAMMDGDAKRVEKLCDLLDTRIREVQITEHTEPMTVTVLESARAVMSPIKPKRASILFQALIAGMLGGGGLAFLRDVLDRRVAAADEVQSRLGLGVLGVLPHMTGRETAVVRGQKVHLDPMSDVAESYRTIRTAIYFGAPEDKLKTIVITSPTPGDGKTTSASNLAIAMAQAGQRVVLIDCDFRRPMQHRIFGFEDGIGLTNVIAGGTLLSQAVKTTAIPGLFLLPCGAIPNNPSELLSGKEFASIIGKLKEKFDHVIIDSPPVLPVTDARILGASNDLTVIVVRAQKTTWRAASQACEGMLAVGSRVLGIIVNDVPRRSGRYGYYYYGNYGYGYGYGRSSKSKPSQNAKPAESLPAPTTADSGID